MKTLSIHPVTRDNWETAIQIKIHEEQVPFVPSIYEALTYAYIKPWDERWIPFLYVMKRIRSDFSTSAIHRIAQIITGLAAFKSISLAKEKATANWHWEESLNSFKRFIPCAG